MADIFETIFFFRFTSFFFPKSQNKPFFDTTPMMENFDTHVSPLVRPPSRHSGQSPLNSMSSGEHYRKVEEFHQKDPVRAENRKKEIIKQPGPSQYNNEENLMSFNFDSIHKG